MENNNQNTKSIDVVIPLYYGLGYATRAVKSLIREKQDHKGDFRIIIVDDSGDKQFNKLIKQTFSDLGWDEEVTLLYHDDNLGFIEACYTGVEYGESDYKLILNSDTFLLDGAIEEMIKTAESDERIGLVCPSTNNIAVIDIPIPRSLNVLDLKEEIAKFPRSKEDFIDIVTAVGMCMLIKKEHLEEHGFWDRIFGMGYGEDTDLHFRYVKAGLRAVISLDSFVYHRGEGSFADRDVKTIKAREIFLERHEERYLEDIPQFNDKSVINDVRDFVQANGGSKAEYIFLTTNNSISEHRNRLAHKLANSLIMSGKSTIVLHKDKVVDNTYIDDRMYSPTSIREYHMGMVKKRVIIVTEKSLFRDALSLALRQYRLSGTFPPIVYLGDASQKLSESELNVYDDVLYFGEEDFHAPQDLTILSNVSLKSNPSNRTKIMFPQGVGYKKIHKIGKLLLQESREEIGLYTVSDKSIENGLGNIGVTQYRWLETQDFFDLLKKTRYFVVNDDTSEEEILMALYSGAKLLVFGESREILGYQVEGLGSKEVQIARKISQLYREEHRPYEYETLVKYSLDITQEQILENFEKLLSVKPEKNYDRLFERLNQFVKTRR